MKAALDVHYERNAATAACVLFDDWQDDNAAAVIRSAVAQTAAYRAGRFFQRELPCLLAVLEKAGHEFETIVIDGYVHLRHDAGRGLGRCLYESLPYSPAIIGVAKNPLKIADRFVPVHRGRSRRPLFVSAVGSPVSRALRLIAGMHGHYRIPTLLALADQHARTPAIRGGP